MKFNPHYELAGRHSTLSASVYSWTNYDAEKMAQRVITEMAAQRGTELHAFAAEAIRLGIKLQKTRQTLNMYVNDALSFRMSPEVTLYYSPFAFCTADAISLRKERGQDKMVLRIHDLKTGVGKANVRQLEIYAAYVCLEYGYKPHDLYIELRIYQNDYIQQYEPDPVDIVSIMDKIVTFDRIITQIRMEAGE